jgi:hypothetical protein
MGERGAKKIGGRSFHYLLSNMLPLPSLRELFKEKPLPLAVEQVGSSRHYRAFLFFAASSRIKQATAYGGGT